MLPKEHRLARKKDFDRIYRQGRSFFIKELGIKTAKNGLDISRFGFVVSLKVSKKAVERNLIKRRLREIIRETLPEIRPGFDCAVIVRPGGKDMDYGKMKSEMRSLLERSNIMPGREKLPENNDRK